MAMASSSSPFSQSPLLVLLSVALLPTVLSSVGINYGQIANNLPSPENVVPLVRSIGAARVKLYDANPAILKAFANTGVELMVCIGNELLGKIRDPKQSLDWVKRNVDSHLPASNITTIVVGNEVLTFNDTVQSQNLLPAMQSVHSALASLGLEKRIAVTTTHSLSVLETSYPPAAGAVRKDLSDLVSQILSFHARTGSPFLLNAYPFFAYKANPKQIPLDFVLFEPNQGVVDPISGLHYDNMLFAQIDAVYTALASLGYKKVSVHVSETGWPSKGDADEFGASPENAKKYNGNLIKLMSQNRATPMRPESDLRMFVFALFNENMKPGPASERNYGLFKPDGTPAYQLGFARVQGLGNSNSNYTAAAGGGGLSSGVDRQPQAAPERASATGYLSVSFATASAPLCRSFVIIFVGLVFFAVRF